MPEPFDFKEQARALLKRITQNPANPALVTAAVEAALREAYARGQEDAKVKAPATPKAKAPFSPASSKPASPSPAQECAHEWEETFLDGRTLGSKCTYCGILERDVQERCDHYFVQTNQGEVCVACRKPKKSRS